MEWTRLDLRKASVLRKEVDLAVRLLSRINVDDSEGNGPESYSLIESVQKRIQEIEEFYTENDDDERSILFEKQRLRLRRALQSVNAVGTNGNGKPGVTGAAKKAEPSRVVRGSSFGSEDLGTPSKSKTANSVSPVKSTLKSASKKGPRSPDSAMSLSRPQAPIYAWELSNRDQDAPDVVRERISTDSASFIPSSATGIYICDSEESKNADMDDLIDFQVVLSAEEFQVYVSRRRTAVAEKKHSERFLDSKKSADEKQSLLSSTPYVDPKRIQRELLRPPQPHKWVAQSGFRPVGSKIQ